MTTTTTTTTTTRTTATPDAAPAAPARVSVQELAGSVVVLAPGRSLLVTHDGATAWRATARDSSVAAITAPAPVAAAGGTSAVDAGPVCCLTAGAPGHTRGHLVSSSGQHHPFEVVVLAPRSGARPAAPASRRADEQPLASWAARCRRALRPLGRWGAGRDGQRVNHPLGGLQ